MNLKNKIFRYSCFLVSVNGSKKKSNQPKSKVCNLTFGVMPIFFKVLYACFLVCLNYTKLYSNEMDSKA